MDLQSVLDKIDYIGQKRNMKLSDIQTLKAAITHLNEKGVKKKVEYVGVMDSIGDFYEVPFDLKDEFNELDKKITDSSKENLLNLSQNHMNLVDEWYIKFEKYRIKG